MTAYAGDAAEASASLVRDEATDFRIGLFHDWRHAAVALDGSIGDYQGTPFQDFRWLAAWYGTYAADHSIRPLIVVVSETRSRDIVVILPLHVHVQQGVRIAEFAGAADYNAPILGPAANKVDAAIWWPDLCRAVSLVPGGCDLIRFRKMPRTFSGRVNPLDSLEGMQPGALTGHLVQVGDDYNAYRYSLERTVRKELERSWRVFAKHDGARFQILDNLAVALDAFDVMEAQQGARMRELGEAYTLDDERSTAFHRDLIVRGLTDGYLVMSALTCGDEIVAILLGIRKDAHYVMVRISNAGGRWSNCSPGRLVIERTMAALHADGVRAFDFSVGTYDYKRRFGVSDVPLLDFAASLTWRGLPVIARDRLRRWMRRVMPQC